MFYIFRRIVTLNIPEDAILPHIKLCNVHDFTRVHHALGTSVKPLSASLDNYLDLIARHLVISKLVMALGHLACLRWTVGEIDLHSLL